MHSCVGEKLAQADAILQRQGLSQASQLGMQRLTGFRAGQQSLHGQGLAIDIDAATNPYVIHERNEDKLDLELTEVYERIAQFLLGRASVLPHLGRGQKQREARRAYAARIYDTLAQESRAMQQYFSFMQQGSRLQQYMRSAVGIQRARLPTTFLSVFLMNDVAQTPSNLMFDQVRLRMAADWVILTGYGGPPLVALDPISVRQDTRGTYLPYPQIPTLVGADPERREGERPFDAKTRAYPGRSPLNGFLTLRKELVLALIDVGFRWGAIDFGRSSGDLMHFDSKDTTCDESSQNNLTPLGERGSYAELTENTKKPK